MRASASVELFNATCRADLAFVVATLRRQRGLKLRRVGSCRHTEVPTLAAKRARRVRDYLCEHGVLRNQLRPEGAPAAVVGGVMERGSTSVSFRVVQVRGAAAARRAGVRGTAAAAASLIGATGAAAARLGGAP